MKLRIEIDGTVADAIFPINIKWAMSGRISQATFSMNVTASVPILPIQQSEVIIYNDIIGDDTDAKVFRGFVVSKEANVIPGSAGGGTAGATGTGTVKATWKITCNGLESLLDDAILNATYTAQTDRQIIQAAFGAVLPSITTLSATVSQLTSAINFTAKDSTLNQFMTNLCAVSGGQWRITENSELLYGTSPAGAFGFSDVPNAF